MPEDVIHPLRRRMVEDMILRNFDPRTQQAYIRSVRSCCRIEVFERRSEPSRPPPSPGYRSAFRIDSS